MTRSRSGLGLGCLCVLCLASCSEAKPHEESATGAVSNPLIFGSDERVNVEDVEDNPIFSVSSDAVALLGLNKDDDTGVCEAAFADPGICFIPVHSPREYLDDIAGQVAGLCRDQAFANEAAASTIGVCTAFWVGDDVFVTAGHCLKKDSDPAANLGLKCSETRLVFSFDISGPNPYASTPNISNLKKRSIDVYDCSEVIDNIPVPPNSTVAGHNEWAVFRVDRKVVGHHPLHILRSGNPALNAAVNAIGHGMALPTKVDTEGVVHQAAAGGFFGFNGDDFIGNSGGPVIDPKSGIVQGVVTGSPAAATSHFVLGTELDDNGNPTDCSNYAPPCDLSSGCPGFTTAASVSQSRITAAVPEANGLFADLDFDGLTDGISLEDSGFGTYDLDVSLTAGGSQQYPTALPTTLKLDQLGTVFIGDFNADGIYDVLAQAPGFPTVYVDGGSVLSLNVANSPFVSLLQASGGTLVRDLNEDNVEDLVLKDASGRLGTFLGGPSLVDGVKGGLAPMIPIPRACGTQPVVQENVVQCPPHGGCFDSLTDYRATRAVAVVPGDVAGFPSSPTLLAIDCPGSARRSQILLLDPADGSTKKTIDLSGGNNWRAFAYRADTQDLIALESTDHSEDHFVMDVIKIASGAGQGTVTQLGTGSTGGGHIATGIGWNMAGQQARVLLDSNDSSNVEIDNYDTSGVFVNAESADYSGGCAWHAPIVSPPHVGGMLVDSNGAAVACNHDPVGIPIFNASSTVLAIQNGGMASKPQFFSWMLHDLECDPLTYAALGKTVVWGIARGGRALRAYDYPADGCGLGGDLPATAMAFSSFESTTRVWTSPDAPLTYDTTNFSEGKRSLSVPGAGRVVVTSPVFSTTEFAAIGDQLAIDVFIPRNATQTNDGHVKITTEIPSAGLHNVQLGTVQFKSVPRGLWSTIEVGVPTRALAAFDGTHTDTQIVMDIHYSGTQPILFDRMRFAGNLHARPAQ